MGIPAGSDTSHVDAGGGIGGMAQKSPVPVTKGTDPLPVEQQELASSQSTKQPATFSI